MQLHTLRLRKASLHISMQINELYALEYSPSQPCPKSSKSRRIPFLSQGAVFGLNAMDFFQAEMVGVLLPILSVLLKEHGYGPAQSRKPSGRRPE